jgi:hypothetical protein
MAIAPVAACRLCQENARGEFVTAQASVRDTGDNTGMFYKDCDHFIKKKSITNQPLNVFQMPQASIQYKLHFFIFFYLFFCR